MTVSVTICYIITQMKHQLYAWILVRVLNEEERIYGFHLQVIFVLSQIICKQ